MKKFILLVLLFILAACNRQALETPNPTNPNLPNGYPLTKQATSYPPPEDIQQGPLTQITQLPGKGAVKGKLLLNGRPVVDVNIFLAAIIKDTTGEEIIADMDQLSSPRSYTNSQGEFLVSNVDPGRYAVIIDVAVNSSLLFKVESNDPLLVTVSRDTTVDLGDMNYQELPIPNHYVK